MECKNCNKYNNIPCDCNSIDCKEKSCQLQNFKKRIDDDKRYSDQEYTFRPIDIYNYNVTLFDGTFFYLYLSSHITRKT
jgi:hypothetical protein